MPLYAAFLRAVSPTNLKMPDLKRCFEQAGFADVKTVLATGNVVFEARSASIAALERRAEAALQEHLGRSFLTIVRPVDSLREMIAADPYRAFRVKPDAKRVVTFLRGKPQTQVTLPIELDGARILCVDGQQAFTAYVPSSRGAVFMSLIEKTFGKDVTTRTWETVKKIAR